VSHYFDSDPTKIVQGLRTDGKVPSAYIADTTTANAQVRARTCGEWESERSMGPSMLLSRPSPSKGTEAVCLLLKKALHATDAVCLTLPCPVRVHVR